MQIRVAVSPLRMERSSFGIAVQGGRRVVAHGEMDTHLFVEEKWSSSSQMIVSTSMLVSQSVKQLLSTVMSTPLSRD